MVTHGTFQGKCHDDSCHGYPLGACTMAYSVNRSRPWGMPWCMFFVAYIGHPTDSPMKIHGCPVARVMGH